MFPDSKSPPEQQVLLNQESPVHIKEVHSSHSYQNELLENMGLSILEITLQTFMVF
jgi:hypothetical protein